ncbi:MAG TPA: hypothetical protein DDY46_04915, partial [Kocuria sp.]|nr:hypothetical protein [Kocuria sp.]
MDPMDSLATWPTPRTVNDRGFDAAAMRQLGRAPSGAGTAASSAGAAEPGPADGAGDTAEGISPQGDAPQERGAQGAPGAGAARKPSVGERL